ncbi:MAG: M48 family metallopeptidase [Candidatus Omnitrophota bacterium]|nr:M48 family metallopeptidase [Candidatus Omnitrophota bacterium]
MANIYEEIGRNRRNTWFIIIAVVSFFLFIGAGLDYFYGAGFKAPFFTIIALLVGTMGAGAGYLYGDKMILSATRARALNMNDPGEKQWYNVIGEVSIAAGAPLPEAYIIDDPDPNAFATGRDPRHASIAVTKGLVDALNRDELQAVAAHEMSHVKNYDVRLMLMVAALVGAIALMADWAGRSLFYARRRDSGRSGDGSDKGGGVGMLILLAIWLGSVVLAPILSRMMAMFVSRRREYLADASGAELTRNPLALASALEKITARAGPTRYINNQGTAHLCIADPKGSLINSKEGWWADLFATHPPIDKRIEALRRMAYVRP